MLTFARAMIVSNRVIFRDGLDSEIRELLVKKMQERGIGTHETLGADLGKDDDSTVSFPSMLDEPLTSFGEGENDWQVYEFVNRYKNLFRIPDNTAFQVHAPLVLVKSVYRLAEDDSAVALTDWQANDTQHENTSNEETAPANLGQPAHDESETGEDIISELLIKVSWKKRELVEDPGGYNRELNVRYGTTISFDLKTRPYWQD